jgi:hypothetical protein
MAENTIDDFDIKAFRGHFRIAADHFESGVKNFEKLQTLRFKLEAENKQLQHYKDSTSGLWALHRDPKGLLREFWQRSSDACPVEAAEAEKQENEFADFVEKLCFQLKDKTGE